MNNKEKLLLQRLLLRIVIKIPWDLLTIAKKYTWNLVQFYPSFYPLFYDIKRTYMYTMYVHYVPAYILWHTDISVHGYMDGQTDILNKYVFCDLWPIKHVEKEKKFQFFLIKKKEGKMRISTKQNILCILFNHYLCVVNLF